MAWSKPWQDKDGEDIKGQYTSVNIYTKDEVKEEITTVVDNHGAEKVQLNNSNFNSTDVNGALEELFISVSNGKSKIAAAITDKGVDASGNDSFTVLATKVSDIQGGGGGRALDTPSGLKINVDVDKKIASLSWMPLLYGTANLKGYNVYLNNVRLNTSPLNVTSYEVTNIGVGIHDFAVTSMSVDGVESARTRSLPYVGEKFIMGIDIPKQITSSQFITLIDDILPNPVEQLNRHEVNRTISSNISVTLN